MAKNRLVRLNSLLQEVISEVIHTAVRNPHMHPLVSVTRVDISADLHHAKVYISVLGTDKDRQETITALQSAAGFIAVQSSKKVVLRYFPELLFKLDTTLDAQLRIESLLDQIKTEQAKRGGASSE